MKDSPWYLNALEKGAQLAFSCLPAPVPSQNQLRVCKLVGHRGAHAGTSYIENTLPAFDALADAGVWGVELDVRWTKDLVPVISHDPDCRRLFQSSLVIADTAFAQLRRHIPRIPSLEEVVTAFGKRLHLMLEIKAEAYPQPKTQAEILQTLLSALEPVKDYHMLALDPALFSHVPFTPPRSRVLVGTLNTLEASELAQTIQCGGIAGAYPLFTQKLRRAHQRLGQKIGTGHIDSKRLLFREIAKGTDWIFSNRALQLQTAINKLVD